MICHRAMKTKNCSVIMSTHMEKMSFFATKRSKTSISTVAIPAFAADLTCSTSSANSLSPYYGLIKTCPSIYSESICCPVASSLSIYGRLTFTISISGSSMYKLKAFGLAKSILILMLFSSTSINFTSAIYFSL